MKLLIPDYYYDDIYHVSYKKLKEMNIKCLLFDLDNTCVGYYDKNPNDKLKRLFLKLNKMGFCVIIFSNASRKRLKPFGDLSVICHPFSKKPLKHSFKKIMRKYSYKKEEVCIIGDQLFTDVLGGNRVGIMTCLVDPMTSDDFIVTKFFRRLERKVSHRLKKTDE